MNDLINWNYVAVYFAIGIPLLLLMCRGIDTKASELPSELNENKSK